MQHQHRPILLPLIGVWIKNHSLGSEWYNIDLDGEHTQWIVANNTAFYWIVQPEGQEYKCRCGRIVDQKCFITHCFGVWRGTCWESRCWRSGLQRVTGWSPRSTEWISGRIECSLCTTFLLEITQGWCWPQWLKPNFSGKVSSAKPIRKIYEIVYFSSVCFAQSLSD